MSKPVVVLGATGSIGLQTLEIADKLGLVVAGIAAKSPSEGLSTLARDHPDAVVAVSGGSQEQRDTFADSIPNEVVFGTNEVVALASTSGTTVVNGIVGAAGLRSSVAALEAGNTLALANKESLVAGGSLLTDILARSGELIPVDSEHSALYPCLLGEDPRTVSRLILTASGGPFRGLKKDELEKVTPEQALNHPTWNMGSRITIDSATLFNKGLELIEAHFLFGVPYQQIEVVVHPQSILHSAVEFSDGALKGHMGHPDMRVPIQYALTAPSRDKSPTEPFDLRGLTLEFEELDRSTFPAVDIARKAGLEGGSSPAVLNAADEIAVAAFLQGRLGFLGISEVVAQAIETVEWREVKTIDDVLAVDAEARETAAALIAGAC